MMDSINISVFNNIFQSISEEMGKILQFSAFSPNIKERMDFSCALFTDNGDSFSFGTHIPVHLGAMPLSVKTVIDSIQFSAGDMVVLNDPFMGGTHLPDITLIAPVFYQGKVVFFVANRAHHSDVGGIRAGSMPLASEIFQEGIIIPPVKLIKEDKMDEDLLNFILANVRTPVERRGDLLAQIAANKRGIKRISESISKYGFATIDKYSRLLIRYSAKIFKSIIKEIPDGQYEYQDKLDDDGFSKKAIYIKVNITIAGEKIVLDFTGSDGQVKGGVNTNRAVTYSAVLYVLTSLLDENIPINSGIMDPVQLILPPDSIVNASKPSSLAAGNVETSQRIVDVLLGAFYQAIPDKIPAASQGTMNNISFGGDGYAYYETIGGGSGASSSSAGESAVHTHMTNSLNTPIEALEIEFPVEIVEYSVRFNSGGAGKFRGGNGLIRAYKFLKKGNLSILSERRRNQPYGLLGGAPGKAGENILIRKGKKSNLSSKVNLEIDAGDIIVIKTPGGGGYGEKE